MGEKKKKEGGKSSRTWWRFPAWKAGLSQVLRGWQDPWWWEKVVGHDLMSHGGSTLSFIAPRGLYVVPHGGFAASELAVGLQGRVSGGLGQGMGL